MPTEMQEHIFGEIKHLRNGTIKATGGHAVSDQVKISNITNIQYNNVFQAKVEIYDPVTNQYILKSKKGKVIYSNNETGVSIVYDKNGNYFRIEDTTKPRGRNYLDINGNDMNNEIVNGKQRGRNRADYQRVTHFNNTD